MNLHLDKPTFQTLLLTQFERTKIRADILEKDYYVCLILHVLSEKQKEIPAYFKGGTALYKALGQMRRFSEDIDLTVKVEGLTKNQSKKRLEGATKQYICLTRNIDETRESTGTCTTVYNYDSVVEVDEADELQRFKRVKVEATSFTISEPHEPMTISPMILENATDEERQILETEFEVMPFEVETIKLDRIFIDKVFAAEFYFLRKEYFDTAKHVYDISVLVMEEKIRRLLESPEELEYLVGLKRTEETQRRGSELATKKIAEFSYLMAALRNEEFLKSFQRMQDQYIFKDNYRLRMQDLSVSLSEIHKHFSHY